MQLLSAPASPFARKARVVVIEAGLEDAVEIVDVTATPIGEPDPRLLTANPVGKIPTLVRHDGPALYDSRVICRYLDAVAGTKLYPEDAIWDTLTLEATADAIMDAAVLMTYERRFRAEPNADWLAGQWAKIERALSALEARWMSHLEGPDMIGQIAVGCALAYLDFRHADREWRRGHGALSAWEGRFAQRPALKATMPEG
ncbi:MAG: glutathione S-transferase [Alphaproteobacteria bacterium]|nr:MAG: glutathione S-transferase [Alphaproteobacteria bacterium]